MTLPQDPKVLRSSSEQMFASLIACGLDIEKCVLYKQSDVLEHTQLSWILSCVSTLPQLQRLPQFKDKMKELPTKQSVPFGLLSYPVLQAADILLHKAEEVPVGDDQLQQIHFAQDLAAKFNRTFGDTFPNLKPRVEKQSMAHRLKSLRDPAKKMSKSDNDPKSRISLTDSPDEIRNKCMKAVTDFQSKLSFNPNDRPGVSNLITIHSLISGKTVEKICEESSYLDTAQYKLLLADELIQFLGPIQKKLNDLLEDKKGLREIMENGKSQAAQRARKTLIEVKNKVGLS